MAGEAGDRALWVEASAKVTSCRYQFARMNTLTFGVQTGEKFQIAFEYRVKGTVYTGEFQSAVAIAQGERISVRYDPRNPGENDRSASGVGAGRGAVFAIGIAGSVVLSLVWLAMLRGCQ